MPNLDTVTCRDCGKPYQTVGIPGTCPTCMREYHKAFEHDAQEAAEVNAAYAAEKADGYEDPPRCAVCGDTLMACGNCPVCDFPF